MRLENEMYGTSMLDEDQGPELPSQVQNERTIRKIEKAARSRFPRKQREIFYEHGHYWLTIVNWNSDGDGAVFDVVDANPGIAGTGFDFEQVS